MRRRLLILCVVVVGTVCVVGGILLIADFNRFRPQIEQQLESRLNRDVSLGTIGLKLLPLAFRVENLSIAEAAGFASSRPFVTAGEVAVRVSLVRLLGGEVEVKSLTLEQPSVELIKNAQGVWNYASIGKQEPSKQPGSPSRPGISFDQLDIENGQIAITDIQEKKPRVVYDHIDLSLPDFAPGKQFQLEAAIRLPGSSEQAISLEGRGGPLKPEGVAESDFDGRITLRDASLNALLKSFSSGSPADFGGTAGGGAEVEMRNRTLKAHGNLAVNGTKLGYPVNINFSLQHDLGRGLLRVSPLEISGGGAQLTGTVSIAGTAISGSGTLKNANVPVEGFTQPLKIHGASVQADGQTAKIGNLHVSLGSSNLRGEVTIHNFSSPDVQFIADVDQIDVPEMQRMRVPGKQSSSKSPGPSRLSGKGTVSIATVRYANIALNNLKAACVVENGTIHLAPVASQIAGGTLGGSVVIDAKSANSAYTVNGKLEQVDANQLLSAGTALKNVLYGKLSSESDARFVVAPGQDIARTLSGRARVQLSDGKVQGFNVVKEMGALGKFLGAVKQTEQFTTILALTGTMNINNGIAQTDDLQLTFEGGSMGAAGTVNLVDQSVNLRVTTVLGPELTKQVGGHQIVTLAGTVLENDKGELVIPAIATGTLSGPRFAPDVQRLAEMKLQKTLPTSGSGVAGIIGAIKGKPKPAQQSGEPKPANEPKPAENQQPLDSILDILKPKPTPTK